MAESLCAAYRRAVRRRLICPAADRTRLTQRLEAMTAAFAEENPSAGAQEWQDTFGSPEALARDLLAECDPAALAQARRRRSWLVWGAIALMAALLVAAVSLAAYFYYWNSGGYYTVTTKVYVTQAPPTPPPPGATATIRYHYD